MFIETIYLPSDLVKTPIYVTSKKLMLSKQHRYLVRNCVKTSIDAIKTAIKFLKTLIDLISKGPKLGLKLLFNN